MDVRLSHLIKVYVVVMLMTKTLMLLSLPRTCEITGSVQFREVHFTFGRL